MNAFINMLCLILFGTSKIVMQSIFLPIHLNFYHDAAITSFSK